MPRVEVLLCSLCVPPTSVDERCYGHDQIDEVGCWPKHNGFTQEELDSIINYDIRYRIGKELKEAVD